MRRICPILLTLVLCGCAGPQGVISVPLQSRATFSVTVKDERPELERKNKLYASCSNQGAGWNGVEDGAFTPSRIELLRARLASVAGDKPSAVTVKHFQNCYLIRSTSGVAGFAGISYPLAVPMEAAHKRGDDLLLTYIALEVNGRPISATDFRPFRQGAVMTHPYEKKETAELIARSTEAALNEIAEKARDSLGR